MKERDFIKFRTSIWKQGYKEAMEDMREEISRGHQMTELENFHTLLDLLWDRSKTLQRQKTGENVT